jgi:hypothetical protein
VVVATVVGGTVVGDTVVGSVMATVVVDTAALVVVATPVVAEAALLFVPLDEHAASSATHHTTHTPVPHLRRMPRPFVSSGHQSTCIRSVRIDPIQIE